MNIDDLFNKMEENPIKFFLTFWVGGAVLSLIGLVLAILIIVGVLNLVGVL